MQGTIPELHTGEWSAARTDTGFRTVLLSPAHSYSVLTAAQGFLSPFRLPRMSAVLGAPATDFSDPEVLLKKTV